MPIRWIHCQDMITPFLTGVTKDENPVPKLLGPTHRTVLRLIHLLGVNTTTYSADEIRSLIYQVDNIQIRLFQWDTPSIKLLLQIITNGGRHTFRQLKYGIRRLLKIWHMTVNNVTNLLMASRLFRPACVNVIAFDGSTKSSKGTTYTTLDQETTTSSNCADDDGAEEERRRRG
ncbi:uncharacterized protein LOC126379619 [Pectinophora gossypiella]|uniref:uncharacterized protein LOC126379619 n=1 Tax=Pectinophora gossypiella TaxID=13191 RepID=UPI00214EABED|nr:uncharacterized protein LOC126379619 [Pectinophora gossypiella]